MIFPTLTKSLLSLPKKLSKFLLVFISAIILFLPHYAIAGCSPYIGQASLNEFFKNKANQSLSSADFAEVKILNDAIDISIYASWQIKICEQDTGNNNSSDGCSALIPLSDFTDLTKPWLVLQDGTIGNYINTKTGFDAVLLDAGGNLIDYLTVDSYSKAIDDVLAVSGSSCDLSNLIFDYDAGTPGTSDKYVSRSPDGTGNWAQTASAADPGTNDNTNDKPPAGSGGGTLPVLSVSDVTVNKGDNVIFTFTLSKTVTYDVSVQYQVQGGTAVPYVDASTKYDYTKPIPGTITFPANTTVLSQTVAITTNATNPANNGSVFFYLYLYNQINATINNNYPSATINAANTLHHIEFIHDGNALTCSPEPITVNACANADCSTLSSTSVTVALSPTGWVGGDSKTISTGTEIFNLKHTVAEIINLNTTSTNPVTTNPVVCKDSTDTITSCNVTFSDSGFIFNNDTDSNTIIPTQLSGKNSNIGYNAKTITLQAVRKSDSDPNQCTAAFLGQTLNIDFAAECKNPSSCISGQLFTLNGSTLTATTNDNTIIGSSSYDTRSVTFDTDGKYPLVLNYPEAGLIELHARHNILLADGTTTSGNYMSGSSSFVVRPLGFALSNLLYATDSSGNLFKKAGEDFITTFTAVRWQAADDTNNDGIADNGANLTDNTTTQNFGNEITPVIPANITTSTPTVTLVPNAGFLTNSANSTSFTDGVGYKTYNWSEVGIFNLTTTLSNYLASSDNIIGSAQNIGRFVPDHFNTTVIEGCTVHNNYTYSGQPFSITAIAKNKVDETTKNYGTTFAFDTTISNAGTATNFTENIIPLANFSNGIGIKVDITYTFPSKETIPEIITLRARDADTLASVGIIEATTEIRSGRMRLENVFGPELTPLIMPLSIEYYSDNTLIADTSDDGFVRNNDDTCSSYDATLGALTNYTGNLSTGETIVTGAGLITAGQASIAFTAPGTGNDGSVNLLANNVSSWLTYNWNVDCDNADADDDITTGIDVGLCGPSGIASFGLYRGDDRIIYWREVF